MEEVLLMAVSYSNEDRVQVLLDLFSPNFLLAFDPFSEAFLQVLKYEVRVLLIVKHMLQGNDIRMLGFLKNRDLSDERTRQSLNTHVNGDLFECYCFPSLNILAFVD